MSASCPGCGAPREFSKCAYCGRVEDVPRSRARDTAVLLSVEGDLHRYESFLRRDCQGQTTPEEKAEMKTLHQRLCLLLKQPEAYKTTDFYY